MQSSAKNGRNAVRKLLKIKELILRIDYHSKDNILRKNKASDNILI